MTTKNFNISFPYFVRQALPYAEAAAKVLGSVPELRSNDYCGPILSISESNYEVFSENSGGDYTEKTTVTVRFEGGTVVKVDMYGTADPHYYGFQWDPADVELRFKSPLGGEKKLQMTISPMAMYKLTRTDLGCGPEKAIAELKAQFKRQGLNRVAGKNYQHSNKIASRTRKSKTSARYHISQARQSAALALSRFEFGSEKEAIASIRIAVQNARRAIETTPDFWLGKWDRLTKGFYQGRW